MALFVVQHKHDSAVCPAGDQARAAGLLQLLAGAPSAGMTIRAEAVVDGAHELHLIADAPNAATVEQFLRPFAQMGSVTVRAASLCERVVERGFC